MNTTLSVLSTVLLYASSIYCINQEIPADGVTITLTPLWQQLGHGKAAAHNFGGAWICAGTITIKKRINETLSLSEAVFRWHGTSLSSLRASLYRKNGEPFIPIEENLVSDGIWKSSQQILTFSFSNKQILDPVTTFYLVLTVPAEMEQPLQAGNFELLANRFPEQVQSFIDHSNLVLALKDLTQHASTKVTLKTRR